MTTAKKELSSVKVPTSKLRKWKVDFCLMTYKNINSKKYKVILDYCWMSCNILSVLMNIFSVKISPIKFNGKLFSIREWKRKRIEAFDRQTSQKREFMLHANNKLRIIFGMKNVSSLYLAVSYSTVTRSSTPAYNWPSRKLDRFSLPKMRMFRGLKSPKLEFLLLS